MSLDWTKDVAEFHKLMNYPNGDKVESLEDNDFHQRVSYLEEEIGELKHAHHNGNLYEEVDSLLDLAYYTIGTLLRMGVDPRGGWNDVHRANMDKLPSSNWKHSIKPEGWRPPQRERLLRKFNA